MNRARISCLAGGLIFILVLAYFYAAKIEPNQIQTTKYNLAKNAQSLRIAQLTDFHIEDEAGLKRIAQAIAILKAQHPDVIVLTGDFITDYIYQPPEFVELLQQIQSIAPTFAIAGNHDGGFWAKQRGGYQTTNEISRFIRQSGIRFLQNTTDSLTIKNRRLEIYGSGDLWAGYCRHATEAIFSGNPNSIKILLTHNPDSKFKFKNAPWDYMFCGHTHGGQVVLPLIGAPRLPIVNKKFIKGIFEENKQTLIVSAGIGCLHGIRFNSRPEVVIVDL